MKKAITILLLVPTLLFSQQKEEKKEDKPINYAFIPIVMYNSSFGGQFGLMTSAFFDINKSDTISPASSIGFMGSYFTNTTYFTVLFSKLHFNEDNYRTKTGIGLGNIVFQTFINYPDIPTQQYYNYTNDEGQFIDYNTKLAFVYLEGTKRIWNDVFLGLRISYSQTVTHFDNKYIPDETDNLFGFGLASEYDNRDNVFNPNTGQNAKLNTFTYLEALGSSSQYNKIDFQYNKYFKFNDKTVLLARFYSVISTGDVPFSGQNTVGRDDLRGYSNGKFRANQVYDVQTELRWNFHKKWGMVAFGGVAVATDNFNGDNFSGLLPAIGTGIRFKAITSRNINIGIDVAAGKNDWGLYFRIGEAFTR